MEMRLAKKDEKISTSKINHQFGQVCLDDYVEIDDVQTRATQ